MGSVKKASPKLLVLRQEQHHYPLLHRRRRLAPRSPAKSKSKSAIPLVDSKGLERKVTTEQHPRKMSRQTRQRHQQPHWKALPK